MPKNILFLSTLKKGQKMAIWPNHLFLANSFKKGQRATLHWTNLRYCSHFNNLNIYSDRTFHGFEQAKFPDGGSVLGSRQFSILPQQPPKLLLKSKVVKIDPKIIISLC